MLSFLSYYPGICLEGLGKIFSFRESRIPDNHKVHKQDGRTELKSVFKLPPPFKYGCSVAAAAET
jgi:hypothetical protein